MIYRRCGVDNRRYNRHRRFDRSDGERFPDCRGRWFRHERRRQPIIQLHPIERLIGRPRIVLSPKSRISMSAITGPVADQLIAQRANIAQKIDVAIVRKQLDVQQQTGQTINQLIEQTAVATKQIREGYLDVKV